MERSRVEAYRVLGIPVGSDRVTAARAYRRLARSTHPDLSNDPAAAERFATLAAAYRLLLSETAGSPSETPAASGTAHRVAPWAPRVAAYPRQERGRAGGPPIPGPVPVGVPMGSWSRPPIVAGPVRVRPARPSHQPPDRSVATPVAGKDGV